MPFVNEIVSDEDIDKYELGFSKGRDRWWTRDAKRDYYLWGGSTDFDSFGEYFEGKFYLLVDGVRLQVSLLQGEWSQNWHAKPYVIVWDKINWIVPRDLGGIDRAYFVGILKEALLVYGRDGMENRMTPERVVTFGF
jgi:hypothetical protein